MLTRASIKRVKPSLFRRLKYAKPVKRVPNFSSTHTQTTMPSTQHHRPPVDETTALSLLHQHALTPSPQQSLEDKLFNTIGNTTQLVLIGEASHGTHEFYKMRADLSLCLIKDKGFDAVLAEADFPDAFRANMYVKGMTTIGSTDTAEREREREGFLHDQTAEQALGDFGRFPTWMWRNTVVVDFLESLRQHNNHLPAQNKAGFYGLDVYSLHASAAKVIEYLTRVDPDAAKRARARYMCFDRYGGDSQAYGMAVGLRGYPSCEPAALSQLIEMLKNEGKYAQQQECDGVQGEELAFAATANAAVVRGAEEYYRNIYFSEESTWNLRDEHFADTVERVAAHLQRRLGRPAKLIVWAHNSHLGDAQYTDMGQRRGEINVGQLLKERLGEDKVLNIGFSTHTGTVAAAHNWDQPVQLMRVKPSRPGSWENLLHKTGIPKFAVDFKHGPKELREVMEGPMLERAIGVIYRPQTERQSHLFYAELSRQFDVVVHIDETKAVEPLDLKGWEVGPDVDETYPFGL